MKSGYREGIVSGHAFGFGTAVDQRPNLLAASSDHRRDIDGLRAVAVLAIILFHADLPGFSGGYVGVDIFFVISGYLIGGLLLRDLAGQRFSIAGFYARRARRILPALVVLLAATTAVAALLLLSWDFNLYGQSLRASATFTANLHFWLTTSYFDNNADTKPLLHIWSLAVEEQFYLALPLVMLLAWRLAKPWLTVLVAALAVLSLLHAQLLLASGGTGAFYLPTPRAWEFLAGTAMALPVAQALQPGRLAEALALVAIAAIIFVVVFYDEATPFPGLGALPPVIGAAILVHPAASGTRVGRMLGWRPLAVVGLMSYSLYLWHWPIMAFWRYTHRGELGLEGAALSLVLTALLGALSWRYVERPFRQPWFSRPALVLPVSLVALVPLVVIATLIVDRFGYPERLPEEVGRIEAARGDVDPRRDECLQKSLAPIPGPMCRFGEEGAPVRIAVIGDSFGAALLPAFDAIAKERGVAGAAALREGCFPLLDVKPLYMACRNMIRDAVDRVAAMKDVETVVLAARFAAAAESSRFGVMRWTRFITDDATREPGFEDARRVFRDGLERSLAALAGKRVVIVYGIPEQPVNVPVEAALDRMLGRDAPFAVTFDAYRARNAFTDAAMAEIGGGAGAVLIDLGTVLCPGPDRCRVMEDGHPLYSDDNHLSLTGALSLVPFIDSRMP
jgi:peptidoglycan/LPS O-acetylase OafA/YrhL